MLQNIKPRKYQEAILQTALHNNTLVVLPTGMGKSLIGVMLAMHRQEKYPESRILILAPTRPLAAQWLAYFKKHIPELYGQFELFTGKVKAEKRKKLWQKADIIFSTPQCIQNDLKNNLISLENVSMLCIDECHRCIKNYAYTYVAQEYLKEAEHSRLLGLTASPGSDPKIIKEVCKNLGIETVEARTRESEDVKPYLQKLKTEIIKLDFPQELENIRQLLKKIYDKKIEELKNRKLLFQPATKKNLLELQHKIMRAIASGNKHFNLLAGASACAQTIKLQYCLELLETQTLGNLQRYLKDLFEQAEQAKSRAVKQLVKQPEFNQAYIATTELIARKIENPKLEKLKEIVEKEFKNKLKRIIVFAQYRDTVTRICKELNSIKGVNARVFVGQLKKGETGLSQKEQQEIIRDFSLGKINCLVSTSVGEEGLDIKEVGAVIFYDNVPSVIRKVQRVGRTARLRPGKLIILIIKGTRDESYYWAAFHREKKMHRIIEDLKENSRNKEEEKQKGIGDFI